MCIERAIESHLLTWLQEDNRHLPEERLQGSVSLPRLSSGYLLSCQKGQPWGKLGIGEDNNNCKDGDNDGRWERNCTEQAQSVTACKLPCII